MSRFSQKEAEARGWVFVHDADEETIVTSDVQGERRTIPASIRAEKTINGVNVQAEGETIGLVLERIAAIESVQDSLPATGPAALDLTQLPRDDADFPLRSVRTPEGDFTDAEFTERSRRNDVIVTEDGQQFLSGASIEASPLTSLDHALDERAREAQRIENLRAAEEPFETVHVTTDTSGAVDSPGIGAGASLVVHADDAPDIGEVDEETGLAPVSDPMGAVRERIDAQAQEEENDRVTATEFGLGRTPAPEGEEELAGVDVGIARRSDLASDAIPPIGHTVAAVEDAHERAVAARETGVTATTEGPTAERTNEVEQARIEAVKDTRDEQGAEAVTAGKQPEQAAAATEAAAETEAQSIEESSATSDAQPDGEAPTGEAGGNATPEEPSATPKAEQAAKEHGVDLAKVKGTGKDGKVTKPDVEQHIETSG